MGKRWVAIRLDDTLLERLKQLEPSEDSRTALIEKRLRRGGRPIL